MVGDVNVPGAFRVGGTSINNTNKWITSTTGASDYCKKEDPNPIIHGNISKGAGARNDIHDAVTAMQV